MKKTSLLTMLSIGALGFLCEADATAKWPTDGTRTVYYPGGIADKVANLTEAAQKKCLDLQRSSLHTPKAMFHTLWLPVYDPNETRWVAAMNASAAAAQVKATPQRPPLAPSAEEDDTGNGGDVATTRRNMALRQAGLSPDKAVLMRQALVLLRLAQIGADAGGFAEGTIADELIRKHDGKQSPLKDKPTFADIPELMRSGLTEQNATEILKRKADENTMLLAALEGSLSN